jgi:hypothetical protein
LQKFQPFINELLKRFRAAFVMGRDMSADESMIKYKGKQVQLQYIMPAKHIKHGFKVFALCDVGTGYIYSWYVFTGKENHNAGPVQIILLEQDPTPNIQIQPTTTMS